MPQGSELLSKVIGESESALHRLFEDARRCAPTILFIDHIDAVARKRGRDTSSSGSADRLLSTLLTEIDGLTRTDATHPVFVVGATNSLEDLDEAILRPGRFDKLLPVPLPDERQRRDIWAHHLRRMPCAEEVWSSDQSGKSLIHDSDADHPTLHWLASNSQDLSGADLQNCCREAGLRALHRDLHHSQITTQDLRYALRLDPSDCTPTLPPLTTPSAHHTSAPSVWDPHPHAESKRRE